MSLSGNLQFVPIDEVLRLLTRAKQQGSVNVTGDGFNGRVFVGRGGIDLATTWDDDDLHRHLINSGTADEGSLRRIRTGETTLAAIAESNLALVALLREVTVESLFQIDSRGSDFEVRENDTTSFASPNSFELEKLLEDSRARMSEWDEVSDVVTDLTGAVSFRRDLGEREEVTVNTDDWKVLSEIGVGASVSEIAEQLGTTEFWAARVAARLMESDLVELRTSANAVESDHGWEDETPHGTVSDDVVPSVEPATDDHGPLGETSDHESYTDPMVDDQLAQLEPDEPAVYAGSEIFAPQDSADDTPDHQVDEDVTADSGYDPSDSWWQEPDADDTPAIDDETEAPEVVAEGLSEIPSVAEDGSEVEEDTEAFLEKVFSELESSEPEGEEGHGLLRRRRMGSLRDFSSDS